MLGAERLNFNLKNRPRYNKKTHDAEIWFEGFETELREKLKNIPMGDRRLRFTAGYIHALEEILGE